MDVLLHQFHVSGEAGLRFAEDDLKLFRLGRSQHPVEVRTEAVGAGVVFVAVDGVDVPSMVDGVMGQKRLLVLDALGFKSLFLFILLTQTYIDCTKDLLHLLQGVTAHDHHTL